MSNAAEESPIPVGAAVTPSSPNRLLDDVISATGIGGKITFDDAGNLGGRPADPASGTFGGALVHADPAGDLLAPAVALDAELVIAGPGGRRAVAAAEFFVGLFTTTLEADEILVEVRVPKKIGWGMHYEKFSRAAQAWSILAIAAAVRIENGSIVAAREALTNMGRTVRASAVEQALIGQPASAETTRAAAEHAAAGPSPILDSNADADYREQLARVLTRRAVTLAARTARCLLRGRSAVGVASQARPGDDEHRGDA